MSSSMIEYLVLAGIALFIGWRLYITLGQDEGPPEGRNRTPSGPVPVPNATQPPQSEMADVLPLRPNFTGPAADGLEQIHAEDESFDPILFLQGARAAYKLIVDAFSQGDLATLKPLLDTDVYDAWSQAIKARDESGAQAPTLLRIREAEITEASLDSSDIARIGVEFQAELGDGETTFRASELWTFMRAVKSNDPNWILDDVDTVETK